MFKKVLTVLAVAALAGAFAGTAAAQYPPGPSTTTVPTGTSTTTTTTQPGGGGGGGAVGGGGGTTSTTVERTTTTSPGGGGGGTGGGGGGGGTGGDGTGGTGGGGSAGGGGGAGGGDGTARGGGGAAGGGGAGGAGAAAAPDGAALEPAESRLTGQTIRVGLDQRLTVLISEEVTLLAAGCLPGAPVVFTIESTPVELGEETADETGTAEVVVTIPEGLEPGQHTIKASCTGADGQPLVLSSTVIVGAAPDLEKPAGVGTTGSPSGGIDRENSILLGILAAALVAGGIFIAVRGRRPSGSI